MDSQIHKSILLLIMKIINKELSLSSQIINRFENISVLDDYCFAILNIQIIILSLLQIFSKKFTESKWIAVYE